MPSRLVCGWVGQGLIGQNVGTLLNVPDQLACQRQCQLYSDVAVVTGCAPLGGAIQGGDAAKTLCVGVNYSVVDGRCTLLGDVQAVVAANDFVALPVVCKDDVSFQIDSTTALNQLKTNATVWNCLQDSHLNPTVTNETKAALPSWATHTFNFKESLRNDVRNILKAYAPLPEIRTSSNTLQLHHADDEPPNETDSTESADTETADTKSAAARRLAAGSPTLKNMPKVTADLQNITEGMFYQTGNALAQPVSTLNSLPLVYPRNVNDWRECALLCDLTQPDCAAWSFIYNPSHSSGGCYLATSSQYPTILSPDDMSLRSVAGLALQSLPPYLFGENENRQGGGVNGDLALTATTDGLNAESLHPECHAVQYNGYLFMTVTDRQATALQTNLYSLGATSLSYCAQACSSTMSCVAYQYIPRALAEVSEQLTAAIALGGGANCALFSSLGASPVLHVTDPLAGSGFLSCGSSGSSTDGSPIAQWMSATELQIPETGLKVAMNYVVADKHSCSSSSPWSSGWAIKGSLLSSQPNLIKNVDSSSECDDYCRNVQDCEGWTYGTGWKSCYLFGNVEEYVKDSDCISGQLKCARRLGAETTAEIVTSVSGADESSGVRDLDNCDRARGNSYYKNGSLLEGDRGHIKSPNQCFRLCRTTVGCNYFSWVPKGTLIGGRSHEGDECVLFADVKDSDLPIPLAGGYSSEMICDAIGRAVSKESLLDDSPTHPDEAPLWIALGSVGGVSLVIGSLLGYLRYQRGSSSFSESESDEESVNMSRLILNSSSFHNKLSERLSFQSEIVCEVDPKPQVVGSASTKHKPLVRFADMSPTTDHENAPLDPGTCITMRTEESAVSPAPCIDDLIGADVHSFEPHTAKTLKREAPHNV